MKAAWLALLLLAGAAHAEDGDPAHGRKIVEDRAVSACLLCHSGPFPATRTSTAVASESKATAATSPESAPPTPNSSPR